MYTFTIHVHLLCEKLIGCKLIGPVCFGVGAVTEKSEKPAKYRRKKGLRQLFTANKTNEEHSN